MINSLLNFQKSDTIGALSSGLCMIHCIATPFFFFATTCSATCCAGAPLWWQWLDYFFLIISFFAVKHSTKSTSSKYVKYGLWLSWIVLFVLVLNTRFLWFYISDNAKFIPAFTLIGLHLYNLRYCQCKADDCSHK